VFTFLLEGLGAESVQFEELFALDQDYLKQLRYASEVLYMVFKYCEQKLTHCSPVYGVIFLFKWLSGDKPGNEPLDGSFDHDAAQNIFFAAQTIQNACGTQALLSVLLNQDDKVKIGPHLREFKDFTSAFPSEVRISSYQLVFLRFLEAYH
jgi:ubiquitin carboxyl-terminal hydrolase L5